MVLTGEHAVPNESWSNQALILDREQVQDRPGSGHHRRNSPSVTVVNNDSFCIVMFCATFPRLQSPGNETLTVITL